MNSNFRMRSLALGSALALASAFGQTSTAPASKRNVIIFVADGLRPGSVTAATAPTMFSIRQSGVNFVNSHAMFPTFTMPNGSAIATGHALGDTGVFSNTLYSGYPLYNTGLFGKTPGTNTPFIENDQVLSDMNQHFQQNFLNEQTLLSIARQNGFSTAAIGKVGPTALQDVTQTNTVGGAFAVPSTVIIDDATGTSSGMPLPADVSAALTGTGLSTTATSRNQPSGTNATPGTTTANIGQQQYFADAVTKAVLPVFKKRGSPFVLVFWSRDPDGSQHNQGDSLNSLTPGINGPTSKAAVKNADDNLRQILDFINADPALAGNTDIVLTADHGFATISKHEIDNAGGVTKSYAATFTYKDTSGRQEVNTGFLPAGFVAIDLAHMLGMKLYDPDTFVTGPNNKQTYSPVDPTIPQQTAAIRQRPGSGDGLIGASGQILDQTDAKVVVAANGGSDLVYVPSHDAATVQKIVAFLAAQDYTGGLFVNDRYGQIPGALPMSAINLIGAAITPQPDIVINFKTFSLDAKDPVMTAVQIADTSLQEGQGMHGTLSRDNTFNNMAAWGPDFKNKYVDPAPVSNADLPVTMAYLLGLPLNPVGKLQGRVITEALAGQPDAVQPAAQLAVSSSPADSGKVTTLLYQVYGSWIYLNEARLASTFTQAVAGPKDGRTVFRQASLQGSASVSADGKPLTYRWTLESSSGAGATIVNPTEADAVVQFAGIGSYTFRLTVTDSSGITSTDTTTVLFTGR